MSYWWIASCMTTSATNLSRPSYGSVIRGCVPESRDGRIRISSRDPHDDSGQHWPRTLGADGSVSVM